MRKQLPGAPSPAMFVAVIALVFAMGGVGIAQSGSLNKLSAAKVRAIAKAEIASAAPGLTVLKATSATTATTATTATNATNATNAQNAVTANSANPVIYALISGAGVVDAASSKGITSANVTKAAGGVGRYCFHGLPFTPKAGNATVDFGDSGNEYAQFGIPGTDSGLCAAGDQAVVGTKNDTGAFDDAGFYVVFYN